MKEVYLYKDKNSCTMWCEFGLYHSTSWLQAEGRTVAVAPPLQPWRFPRCSIHQNFMPSCLTTGFSFKWVNITPLPSISVFPEVTILSYTTSWKELVSNSCEMISGRGSQSSFQSKDDRLVKACHWLGLWKKKNFYILSSVNSSIKRE